MFELEAGLESQSNAELNRGLAKKLGLLLSVPKGCEETMIGDVFGYYDESRVLHELHYDYCGDWNSLMPIAVQCKIAVEPEAQAFVGASGRWIATDFNIKHQFVDSDPQRAIVCCLLMMDEVSGAQ